MAYVDSAYGKLAPQFLARYPWSRFPSPYTAAYALGAIFTDSGAVTGIGGCTAENLAGQFAATTRTYFFQFDDRNAPGLDDTVPGYEWGAGHAMELAYLWPSWPALTRTSDRLMSLRPGGQSELISGREYSAEHQCAFWDSAK